jgi:hypothetical protein
VAVTPEDIAKARALCEAASAQQRRVLSLAFKRSLPAYENALWLTKPGLASTARPHSLPLARQATIGQGVTMLATSKTQKSSPGVTSNGFSIEERI